MGSARSPSRTSGNDGPNDLPRLCFVGPLAGRRTAVVVTQGVRLSAHFKAAGYSVIAISESSNRYARFIDIAATIVRRRREIDILIIHTYGGASFVVEDVASLLGQRFGHRIVMMLHGGAMPGFMASHPRWARRVLARSAVIVAPSPYLQRAIRPYGFDCQVIPNVIDVKAYPYRSRRALAPRLFWMRSFHPVYNPLMAVEVLNRLRSTHPGATLVMAGQDKGAQAETGLACSRLGLSDAVRFPGFLDMGGKLREGDQADIFINTSHVDNMPVAVLEACALGLPVVSTDVGGVPDLLTDGQTALLAPDGDVEGMVKAIRRLLGDPDLAARLSANGRGLAERSAWEQVRVHWEALFASLLSGSSVRPIGTSRVRN